VPVNQIIRPGENTVLMIRSLENEKVQEIFASSGHSEPARTSAEGAEVSLCLADMNHQPVKLCSGFSFPKVIPASSVETAMSKDLPVSPER
jgi:hypothetical protein